MITYAQNKAQKLYSKEDTYHNEHIVKDAISYEEKFTFGEMGFNVGMAIMSND